MDQSKTSEVDRRSPTYTGAATAAIPPYNTPKIFKLVEAHHDQWTYRGCDHRMHSKIPESDAWQE